VKEREQQIKKSIASINGVLNVGCVAEETRIQLEVFKADLENELHSILSQQIGNPFPPIEPRVSLLR
jgi:hypothetical protein